MPSTRNVTRLYVEKKINHAFDASSLLNDLRGNLGIGQLKSVRILIRYDAESLSDELKEIALSTVFSEPAVDMLYERTFPHDPEDFVFSVELLPGQYDQRADSAAQCIQLLRGGERVLVRTAKTYVFSGALTNDHKERIVHYLINPVDSRKSSESIPISLDQTVSLPDEVEVIGGFCKKNHSDLILLGKRYGLAMSEADLLFCQRYFRDEERRDPSITELRLLDTYWSDHCRHTTFMAAIRNVNIEPGVFSDPIRNAWARIKTIAKDIFNPETELTLMRMATFSMKYAGNKGLLADLEVSGEINACSIVRQVDVNGKSEPWLIMFKNETHNHPTEIEPFGGAATCLGGAIRDPLSGRSYVYQAMRVTGAADPRQPVSETLPGKLPQRKITREAAAGYSSYGNQIGLSTGFVHEYYHPGYLAKRMEVGAVIGAVARKNIIREEPVPGDKIFLLGGRTGRDGIGGATGSSKVHNERSIVTAGSEVQKGNPPEERKLQRLFRNPAFSRLIKKSNDFGAGGVSVAIGELASGVDINLDRVTKKYEGLDGTELALSESQERMAIVVAPDDVKKIQAFAEEENLEANVIAEVTSENRLRMTWKGNSVVDLSRTFLESSGVQVQTDVRVVTPDPDNGYFDGFAVSPDEVKTHFLSLLADLNVCSQKGLNELFDNTVGAGTVLMPHGGRHQSSPIDVMVAKVPVMDGETTTATAMSFGFDPFLSHWSPFHGGLFAVVEALSKMAAAGVEYRDVRFSLQEYFEKPNQNPARWGKPFAALLGATHALTRLGLASIGGKDSMSGSFNELDVPPSLIAFAVSTLDVRRVISPEFKEAGHDVFMLETPIRSDGTPDLEVFIRNLDALHGAVERGDVCAARAVHRGGAVCAVAKMAFGNNIGFEFDPTFDCGDFFRPLIGSVLIEWKADGSAFDLFGGGRLVHVGRTKKQPTVSGTSFSVSLGDALKAWRSTLQDVFPDESETVPAPPVLSVEKTNRIKKSVVVATPRVIVPSFPGSNCEYDSHAAFKRAGAKPSILVFRNHSPAAISESIQALADEISRSQILMIPGGFSAGDEPDGSGKFIAAVIRNQKVFDAIQELLHRKGLVLGICNGFQALIKTGLLPFGTLKKPNNDSPTVTFNRIGRHISRIVCTRVVSTLSPWLWNRAPGDCFQVAISHGEGRFVAPEKLLSQLSETGQIATQYTAENALPGGRYRDNPNGSMWAVEGISSPDGLIFGKMGHNERFSPYTMQNIPGEKDDRLFRSGVDFFK